jgi:uncharacterized protein (DUF1810 family)
MSEITDPFDLQRFVQAQDAIYEQVVSELQSGRKRTHWMWFVFPQLKDLGSSPRALFYGISSLEEARAYLGHPVLGRRLEEVTRIVIERSDVSLHDLFGSPDDLKFRSSMTLFANAVPGDASVFSQAIESRCGGPDPRTIALLKP